MDGTSVAGFERVLAECGIGPDTLPAAARDDLERLGYHVFAGVLAPAELEASRALVERLAGGDAATGTRHVDLLAEPHPLVDRVLTDPVVLAAAHHVLGRPFRWSGLSCRDPQPGFGEQGLHADWVPRAKGAPPWVATALWMLDDFTAENGATRVVPGTHRSPEGPTRDWREPGHRHPDERVIAAHAGSVLVFDGHLWHAGRTNASATARRALQVSFVVREDRGLPLLEHPCPERLSHAALALLGLA